MNALMMEFVVIMGYAVAIGALLLASRLCIQYHIGSAHLEILWLGMPIRKIPLNHIQSVGTKPTFWAENWSNVTSAKGKRLTIKLHRGLLRNVTITPNQPYVFRTQLERAKRTGAARLRFHVKSGNTEVFLSRALQSPFSAGELG